MRDKGKWRAAMTENRFPVILPINSLFFLKQVQVGFLSLEIERTLTRI